MLRVSCKKIEPKSFYKLLIKVLELKGVENGVKTYTKPVYHSKPPKTSHGHQNVPCLQIRFSFYNPASALTLAGG